MAKHKHKWIMNQGEAECCFIEKNSKSKCDAKLDLQETERRLNAAEALSGGDAKYTVMFGLCPAVEINLNEYANIRNEGCERREK